MDFNAVRIQPSLPRECEGTASGVVLLVCLARNERGITGGMQCSYDTGEGGGFRERLE